MIKFDLLKKEDIGVLLEGFETTFLQLPMKRASKDVMKFIPKGFRAEKLGRLQLIKVFTEALLSKEGSITAYVESEIQRNFDSLSIESYMSERVGKEYPTGTFIVELSTIIFETGMVIPAHIVLMLYGIECSEQEKELSTKLYKAFCDQKNEAEQKGFDSGYSKGKAEITSELEAEQKKNAKLQKSIDSLSAKTRDDKKSKNSEKDVDSLVSENEEQSLRIQNLEKLLREQDDDLHTLYEEGKSLQSDKEALQKANDNLARELKRVLGELQSVKKEAAEAQATKPVASIPGEEMKAVCLAAMKLFTSKKADRAVVLENAEKILSEAQDVKGAWEYLNTATLNIIDEINTALLNNSFDVEMSGKFAELESLLLLESAIQRALRELSYEEMA